MSTTKHTTIEQLKKLALRTKSEIGLVDAKVAGLTTKVNDLVTAGGEPNKLEGIKVNGTLLALTDRSPTSSSLRVRPTAPSPPTALIFPFTVWRLWPTSPRLLRAIWLPL